VDTETGAQCAEESTMARRRRPTYSPEFKAEAIRLARTSADSVSKVARDLGVSHVTLRGWVDATRPAAAEPLTTDERTELAQLRREVRQLREERDILKKATAFFAKHGQ
jgi:transposase-like protein